MNEIVVDRIIKRKNVLKVNFSYTNELDRFFCRNSFVAEYSENIENVPDGVAVIPFVCNVLPIVWLTDSRLILQSIDKDFANCINEIKKGYESMYEEVAFKGEVIFEEQCIHQIDNYGEKAMFFSGGLDSLHTLICHMDEKVHLVSIWGSDIAYQNTEGWNRVYKKVKKTAEQLKLNSVVIRSNFRDFDDEKELDKEFKARVQDSWWHGVKHGIGLLGQVAPYVYLHNISTIYIASSFSQDDGKVRCASHPTIDNRVRFCGCTVIHDGFASKRQQKINELVQYCETHELKVDMHVCWRSESGSNCGRCEKCYRTMAGLIIEGADPTDYGFDNIENNIANMQRCVLYESEKNPYLASKRWIPIQTRLKENKVVLKNSVWWKHIKWIEKTDFNNIVREKKRLDRKIEIRKIKRKIKQKLLSFK